MENLKMKRINDAKLTFVSGGYRGESECPACHCRTMTLAPSILTEDGVELSGYVCRNCGHTEYVAK